MGSGDNNPISRYGLSCPVGGDFYICEDSPTQFIGCCDIDPCKNNGDCPAPSLHSSSFSKSKYSDTLPEACVGDGLWYTCAYNSPPFIGCCKENPCQTLQCSPGNVTAAKLSSNQTNAAPFLSGSSSSSVTPAPSASKGLPAGAIAGIVIGGVIAIAIIGYLLWRLHRSKKVFYHPPAVAQIPPRHRTSGCHTTLRPCTAHTKASSFSRISQLPNLRAHDAAAAGLLLRRPVGADVLGPAPVAARGSNPSHWGGPPSSSARHSRHVSSQSSMGSDYGGSGSGGGGGGSEYHGGGGGAPPMRSSGQQQPHHFQPISELAGSEVTAPEGPVSEIGWSDRDDQRHNHPYELPPQEQQQRSRQQQQQAGLGINS
ncbi:hypothetical protein PG997_015312 [Apiospora hydei]|uniref:Uncharacterized protein n=1 Tax=Apiospora hydei TaxID=1337664 RepID=A0ABR1UQA6_9PEZI